MATRSFKNGDKVRVKNSNYTGYGVNKGDIVTIVAKGSPNSTVNWPDYGNFGVQNVHIELLTETKEEIVSYIEKQEKLIQEAKDKLAWMKETDSEVFDTDQFKVWQTLTILENKKLTKLEKSKLVANLIK